MNHLSKDPLFYFFSVKIRSHDVIELITETLDQNSGQLVSLSQFLTSNLVDRGNWAVYTFLP